MSSILSIQILFMKMQDMEHNDLYSQGQKATEASDIAALSLCAM